ncbi:uncharacterized protein B0H18DRAFT_536192 [Fomitopsis serialis]|uniref:uncharacterized protein n=1 Tax=Fomitopsis serialis TaxID=139415 RepID=UPI00200821AB|nr:uncharacterized protein B0H18DRAFT_536192 [Neoantrodia serialis]KAH9921747.1 hypothetical protein B0H18DRAFT_536192 [Neoantrodia serialis]
MSGKCPGRRRVLWPEAQIRCREVLLSAPSYALCDAGVACAPSADVFWAVRHDPHPSACTSSCQCSICSGPSRVPFFHVLSTCTASVLSRTAQLMHSRCNMTLHGSSPDPAPRFSTTELVDAQPPLRNTSGHILAHQCTSMARGTGTGRPPIPDTPLARACKDRCSSLCTHSETALCFDLMSVLVSDYPNAVPKARKTDAWPTVYLDPRDS